MGLVHSLGYVVVSGEDLQAWERFGEGCLGLQKSAASLAGDHETLFLRMDERSWRLAIESGPDQGLVALGFEVANRSALEALQKRLDEAGYPVKVAPELATQRDVTALVTTTDPNGVTIEFFFGGKTDPEPFVSPRGVRFVTGRQGFGHAVLNVTDEDETRRFYVETLQFRESDIIAFGPFRLTFVSPSPRHHSIAWAPVPSGHHGPLLQHIMIEADHLDSIGRALDQCLDSGVPLQSTLGKHSNDHMISFYCASPSGLVIEHGWNGRQIDDATHVTGFYDAASVWGHRRPDWTNPIDEIKRTITEQQGN